MTIARTRDGGISQRTNVYAAAKMLESAEPVRVLDIAADTKPLPRNKSQTIKFRRPVTLEAVTTPLVEGVTPDVTPFRYEDVEGMVRQYGQLLGITDAIADTHEDPVLMDMSKQCGLNTGRTNEALMWGALRGGTNVFYANGASRMAVNTKLTLQLQRKICMALQAQYAMPLTEVVSGSVKIGTMPIEPGYIAFAHTNVSNDIREIPGFVPCAKYGTQTKLHPREFGAVEDIRYVLSPDLPPFYSAGAGGGTSVRQQNGANADIYPILYVGAHAYGTVPLRGRGAMEPAIVPVNQRDKSDPLAQRGYVGSKWWFLCLILNQLWMARAEVAVSDLS